MFAQLSQYLTKSAILARLVDKGYRYAVHPAETAAGITSAQLTFGFEPGDVRRYGADPTGTNVADAAFALWSSVVGSLPGKIVGTYKCANSVAIPSGAVVDFGSGSLIEYTGAIAAVTLTDVTEVTLRRPSIDISGAGAAAVAIKISGAWLVDIEHPKITAAAAAGTQQGIQINTSGGSANFGAYCIRIVNPNICAVNAGGQVQYGILTQQTAGDSVGVTHLQVLGGWINSGSTASIKLARVSSFRIEGVTLENAGDGLQYTACDNGYISLGEVDATGFAVNPLDATSARIGLVYPSMAGGYTAGYLNTANATPDLIGYGAEFRVYPNGSSSSDYWASYKAQYSAPAAMVEQVAYGGAGVTLRNVDGTLAGGVQELMHLAGLSGSATPAKNLRGSANVAAGTATVAVAFANAEPDANYLIFLQPQNDPVAYYIPVSLTVNGFTINMSQNAPAGGVTFNWLLVR